MYPQGELTRLAAHKDVLRARIAARRSQGLQAFEEALRPVAWLDRAREWWQRISPLTEMLLRPLAAAAPESRASRWSTTLLRWAPLTMNIVRAIRQFRRPAP